MIWLYSTVRHISCVRLVIIIIISLIIIIIIIIMIMCINRCFGPINIVFHNIIIMCIIISIIMISIIIIIIIIMCIVSYAFRAGEESGHYPAHKTCNMCHTAYYNIACWNTWYDCVAQFGTLFVFVSFFCFFLILCVLCLVLSLSSNDVS